MRKCYNGERQFYLDDFHPSRWSEWKWMHEPWSLYMFWFAILRGSEFERMFGGVKTWNEEIYQHQHGQMIFAQNRYDSLLFCGSSILIRSIVWNLFPRRRYGILYIPWHWTRLNFLRNFYDALHLNFLLLSCEENLLT